MLACLDCGLPSDMSRCAEHRRERRRVKGQRERTYYTHSFRKLSARLRKRQPFCSDCGRADDLTLDHATREAYERQEQRLPFRESDYEVACRACNSKRRFTRAW